MKAKVMAATVAGGTFRLANLLPSMASILISAVFHNLALGLHSPRQKLLSLQAFIERLPGSLEDLIERLRELYPPNCEDILE